MKLMEVPLAWASSRFILAFSFLDPFLGVLFSLPSLPLAWAAVGDLERHIQSYLLCGPGLVSRWHFTLRL